VCDPFDVPKDWAKYRWIDHGFNFAACVWLAVSPGGDDVVLYRDYKGERRTIAENAAEIRSLSGILNGTCNYILTEMETTGSAFSDVLADAQRLGYAEADPTMDVGGFDAAHKITILAALAFGGSPNFAAAEVEGITGVDLLDIRLAGDLGYRIKLIASAERAGEGARVQVRPFLVRKTHPIAQADGALNALFIEGERIGRIFLQGPGAGAGPTAAAVAADIADVMAGGRRPVFQAPATGLRPCAPSAGVAAVGRG
jgi:homoserine dehydrogenase